MTEYEDAIRQGRIASVRRILTWLEDNKEYPLPYQFQSDFTHYVQSTGDEAKADLARFAFTFGTCEKNATQGKYTLTKKFGELGLRVAFEQAETCTAKVVGRKVIRRAVYTEPTFVEEEVDDIEYECPASVLKKGSN